MCKKAWYNTNSFLFSSANLVTTMMGFFSTIISAHKKLLGTVSLQCNCCAILVMIDASWGSLGSNPKFLHDCAATLLLLCWRCWVLLHRSPWLWRILRKLWCVKPVLFTKQSKQSVSKWTSCKKTKKKISFPQNGHRSSNMPVTSPTVTQNSRESMGPNSPCEAENVQLKSVVTLSSITADHLTQGLLLNWIPGISNQMFCRSRSS